MNIISLTFTACISPYPGKQKRKKHTHLWPILKINQGYIIRNELRSLINWLITNSGHGNNGKIEWGDVTLPEVNLSEMGIAIVTHLQASNPSVSLLGGRHGCGQIIKEAGSRMCAVKFHNKKLGNSCEKVVDPYIFLQLLKKLCHSACSAQTYPQQVPHTLFSSRSLQCN